MYYFGWTLGRTAEAAKSRPAVSRRCCFCARYRSRKIPSFTSDAYREELLFRSFMSLALSLPGLGLTVGVNDIFGRYSTRLLPLVRHAAEVRIRTHAELDDFCESCILTTGTCPFVSKYPSVIDHCELLFDPYGAGWKPERFSEKVGAPWILMH